MVAHSLSSRQAARSSNSRTRCGESWASGPAAGSGATVLSSVTPLTGFQVSRVFLATDLTQGPHALEQEEQDMVQGQFPLAEFERMIRDGVVRDVTTISAFAIARLKGFL